VVRIPFIALAFALLIGLTPLSNHMSSVLGMEMDAAATSNQGNMAHESADEHSTSTCCDAITPCSLVVDLVFPQFPNIALNGDGERVESSALTIQSIHIRNLSPPPKPKNILDSYLPIINLPIGVLASLMCDHIIKPSLAHSV
jgi:hypothetical protein